MVAPLDAKSTFEVEGETITLRLNFRSISLAEEHGIDLMGGMTEELRPSQAAVLVKCLAVQEHPDFTEDHTIAIVQSAPEELREALVELFSKYAGKAEGNQKGRKAKAE